MKNLDKLRLLLLQEVDFRVLAELQGVDETGVLYKSTSIEGLDLESGGQALPLELLLLPPSVHHAEDFASHVPLLDLFGREEQVFISCVSKQVF